MTETRLSSANPPRGRSPDPPLTTNPALGEAPGVSLAEAILGQQLRRGQLAQAARATKGWLWQGYVATGLITPLTSQWRCGKSTLIGALLARMATGGTLAGLPVAAGRAAVISEEEPGIWDERCDKLGIGPHVSFFCQLFWAKPTLAQWHGLVEAMLLLRRREGLDLVVIDNLATFLPGSNENSAGVMLNGLLPLAALKAEGVGVVLVHHPRKGARAPGQMARGSGALPAYVDILIEKGWVGHPDDASDRRRWLRAFSRSAQTRRQAVIELTADGTDYRDCGTLPDEPSAACWEVLRLVLEEVSKRVTQRQILEQWPEDYVKPDVGTVSRTLRRAVAEGWVHPPGNGPQERSVLLLAAGTGRGTRSRARGQSGGPGAVGAALAEETLRYPRPRRPPACARDGRTQRRPPRL